MDPKERRRQTRRDLRRWGDCARYCAGRQREAEELQANIDLATSLRSPSMDGMPHGTVTSDPTARAAELRTKMVELYEGRIKEILADIEDEMRFSAQIDYAVSTLDPKQRKVLELMYKRGKTVEQVMRILCYEKSNVWKIENAACEALAEFFTA